MAKLSVQKTCAFVDTNEHTHVLLSPGLYNNHTVQGWHSVAKGAYAEFHYVSRNGEQIGCMIGDRFAELVADGTIEVID